MMKAKNRGTDKGGGARAGGAGQNGKVRGG
jgi:hypothetical protein